MTPQRLAAACGAGLVVAIATGLGFRPGPTTGPAMTGVSSPGLLPREPLRFVPNSGQWGDEVRFAALGSPQPALVCDDGFALATLGADGLGVTLRFRFGPGSRPFTGEGAAASPVHVLKRTVLVSAADSWTTLRRPDAWPGVDVVLRADTEASSAAALAYDLVVRDADALAGVSIEVLGTESMHAEADGSLRLVAALGAGRTTTLVQRPPRTFVVRDAREVAVPSRAVVLGPSRFGFVVEGVRSDERLCVDPGFVWSSYLGGSASDECRRVRRLPDGDLVLAGWAGSPDFPTSPGAFRATGQRDAFVARLSGDGAVLRWSTYLGGSELEEIDALALAPDGQLVVGGWTGSADFPTSVGAYQRSYFGGGLLANIGDGFVAKLSSDGSRLIWSSFLGRVGDDFVRALEVLPDGSVVAAGDTTADAFPTTPGVIQPEFRSGNVFLPDVFVAKLDASGANLLWSTYLGGFAQDFLGGLAIAPDGAIVFGGLTASTALPVTATAAQRTLRGFWDGFVVRMSSDARRVIACSYLGGQGSEQVRALAIAPDGEIYAAGRSALDAAATFPASTDALQVRTQGLEDGFVARFSADLSVLRAATMLGGAGDDSCEGIALLPGGGLAVVGWTAGLGFPVPASAAQPNYGGGSRDGFVAQFDPTLAMLRAISYAGGSAKDLLVDVVAGGVGDELIAVGSSFSIDFPIGANPLQAGNQGESDAVVMRFDARLDAGAALELRAPASGPTEAVFAPGLAHDALAFTLHNGAPVAIALEALECGIAGSADASRELLGLGLFVDVDRDGRLGQGDARLAGPIAVPDAAGRVRLPASRTLAADESLELLVVIESRAACRRGAEFAVWFDGAPAIVARRGDDQRRVLVTGATTLSGAARICAERRTFSADLDGDGQADVRDLRALAARLGEAPANAGEDPDDDGVIAAADLALGIDRVLQRAPLFALPGSVDAGGLLVLRGHALDDEDFAASLDATPLARVLATPRVLVFAVPVAAPRGLRTLRIASDGVTRRSVSVEVR